VDAGLPFTQLPRTIERRLLPGAALLWFERAWPNHLKWPVFGWALFAALALLGVWDHWPGAPRVTLLVGLVIGTLGAIAFAFRDVAPPSRAAVLRRLELGSAARAGSLVLLDASPVRLDDLVTARLWERARREATPTRPRFGAPRLPLDDGERYGLLPLLGIALFLGLLLAKGDAPRRLSDSLSPYAQSLRGLRLTATVEPPAYAARPAASLRVAVGGTTRVTALAGARLTLRVEGYGGDAALATPDGTEHPVGNGMVRAAIERGGRYLLHDGARSIAALDVTVAADAVPVVRFDGTPGGAASGALRVAYRLQDDLGASRLMLELRTATERRRVQLDAAALPGKGASFVDLTADPLAGETVALRLLARDGAGQEGFSPAILLRLPERRFTHPVAKRIIALRRTLLRDPDMRPAVAEGLAALAADPAAFGDSLTVYAALRGAIARLFFDVEDARARSTARLMWDTAVDLEDGGSSRALDDLREAMDQLAQQMGKGDDAATAALLQKLQAAMGEMLRRQIEAMIERGEVPAGAMLEAMDLSMLDSMLGDLRDRLAAGDQAGAQAALQNLRRLMESLQFAGPGDPQAAQRAEAAARGAQAARDLQARQRDLQASTIAEGVRRAISGDRGILPQTNAQQQLERAAAGLRRQLGSQVAPQALGQAEQAMAQARAALAEGREGDALRAQERAVEALGKAGQELDGRAKAEGQAAGGAMRPGQAGSGLDPLGRPGPGFGQGLVTIPDPQRRARSEAIRRLLEERAADPKRSADERAYYLRLLKRF
jgi:hypothetical protein